MPRLDQTGPEGEGPMTGRRLGRCTRKGKASSMQNDNMTSPQLQATGEAYFTPGRGRRFRAGSDPWAPGTGADRGGRGGRAGRGGFGMGRQHRFRGGLGC